MKRASWFVLLFLLLLLALATPVASQVNGNTSDQIPMLVVRARYVYVTSWDGSEFSPRVLPEDRQAIVDVQDFIKQWNHWAVLYDTYQADLIIVVMRRGSEDVIWIYDARLPRSTAPLWWVGQRGGLDRKELPLMRRLQDLVEAAEKRSSAKD